jgi:hypothetical protein
VIATRYYHHSNKMKSFLKSLPSHRKKEKSRKARKSRDSEVGGDDQKIRIGCAKFLDQTGELNLDYRRGGGIADFSEAKQSQCSESDLMSALTDEGSFVAGTQIQFPLPMAFSRSSRNLRDKNDDDVDDDIDDTPEKMCPPHQSLLSTALPPEDIVEAPTEIHCPPMSQKLSDNNNIDETIDFGIDFQKREAHENIADETDPLDRSVEKKMDPLDGSVKNSKKNAATLAEPKLPHNNNEPSKVDSSNVENRGDDHFTTMVQNRQGKDNDTTFELNPKEKMEQEAEDEVSVDETHLSLELLKRPDSNAVNTTTQSGKPTTHVELSSRIKASQQHHSPAASKESKSAEQRHINQHQQELTPSSHRSSGNVDFVLSSLDIRRCIEEVEEAKQLSEKDPSIFDVDIEKFHDFLQQFEKYVSALGDASSVEAEELQQIQNEEDQVFAIFDRGMSIDHCNVMFIRDVICTISSGIDDQKRSNHSQASQNSSGEHQRKLDQMATGLDFVFGISGGVESSASQSKVGVTISNSPADNGTKLWFTKRPPSTDASKPPNQQSSTIPSHLNEISEIFTRFAANETHTLQSQLDTTRLALSKLRSHAMTLQAQALKATDHALHADNETKFVREQFEVELGNRKVEYEMQKKSFERAKEGYKADLERKQSELDQVKVRYEKELKEARDELLRLKATRAEQMNRRGVQYNDEKEEEVTNGKNNSKNRRYGSGHNSGNTNDPVGNVRDSQFSSRSHPRNMEYKSSNPVEDTDSKRRKSKDSDSSFSIGGDNHRTALKSYSVNNFMDQSSSNTNLTRSCKAPTKSTTVKNPYKKQIRSSTEEDGMPTFAYQEVVRKRDERMALPGHDCEECRKFLDAIEAGGGDIDRDEIIKQCSRHRSRHKPGKWHLDDWFC